jgi:hypothetical protein
MLKVLLLSGVNTVQINNFSSQPYQNKCNFNQQKKLKLDPDETTPATPTAMQTR